MLMQPGRMLMRLMSTTQRPLWGSRVQAPLAGAAVELSSSVDVDRPLAPHDVTVSRAWVAELTALGLVEGDDAQRLDGALEQVGAQLAAQSPHALRQIKALLNDTRERPDYDREIAAFLECLQSEDGQEGVAAFLEKRAPQWTGR